jgi:hypothetical protein
LTAAIDLDFHCTFTIAKLRAGALVNKAPHLHGRLPPLLAASGLFAAGSRKVRTGYAGGHCFLTR